ncbi:MAG: SGNH/GDSL hydrolase family protein [Ginsengibacter sp.]
MKILQAICIGFFLFLAPSLQAQKDSVTERLNQSNDWPNLRRYRSENEKIGLPAANENRVVFMGNSITDGWINARPDFFRKNPYLDRGISGQTTPQMLIRFRQDVIDLKPKVVVILAGINDIAENTGPSSVEMIENNLMSMAQLAKANNIKVVMCSILPAYAFPWRPGINPVEKVSSVNKWMKNYAAKNHFVYVDYYDAMADERKGLPENLSKDGVHPTAEGYQIMESVVVPGIEKALKGK